MLYISMLFVFLQKAKKKMNDDITEAEEVKEVDIKQMLELQVSEVEMLASMFPNPGELTMDEHTALTNIRNFLAGRIKYEYLHSRVGFTVKIVSEDSKLGRTVVELVCNLPHDYPAVAPAVFTRSSNMNRENHRRLNEDLHSFVLSIERGEICMFLVVEWIQENIKNYLIKDVSAEDNTAIKDMRVDTVFTRVWIYSHHIFSKFKRRDIIEWAHELKLTGFSLPGKPGIICVEGYSCDTEEYWQRLRSLNWKRITVKEREECDIGSDDITVYRKFSNFEEKTFEARGGKGREYHMDLGKLYEFLEKHGCGQIFSVYFGVEGKIADGQISG
ncbi:hypothetical protein ACJMK2_030730 [Sinanodonta woodiana]|uniref:RWD domain-containing protein n=1 Tax=Sinanodonta woodiana TaxID=1069815 RepID=A0ABD3WY24_SINWO